MQHRAAAVIHYYNTWYIFWKTNWIARARDYDLYLLFKSNFWSRSGRHIAVDYSFWFSRSIAFRKNEFSKQLYRCVDIPAENRVLLVRTPSIRHYEHTRMLYLLYSVFYRRYQSSRHNPRRVGTGGHASRPWPERTNNSNVVFDRRLNNGRDGMF